MGITRREALRLLAAGLGAGLVSGRLLADDKPDAIAARFARDVASDVGPGKKFGVDGHAQNYPGNTIICHLNHPGRQFEAMQQVYAELRAQVGDAQMSWLPSSSFHMTVFDGALDVRRAPGDWPSGLPLDASMRECNDYIAGKLRDADFGFEPPIRMVAYGAPLTPKWTAIPLRPVDDAEARRLRSLRDRVAQVIGIRHAGHDQYIFHTTFGYRIRPLTQATAPQYLQQLSTALRKMRERIPVFEMGAPEFCLFNDMMSFQTQFLLK